MPNSVGDARKSHPLPLRKRNVNISAEQGGAAGYRGPGWAKIRTKILERDRFRSTITGLPATEETLEVDHINPFRLGGRNTRRNLRTTDLRQNRHTEAMTGGGEKPARRRLRKF